jgi:AraC family transcriptional regulator
MALNFEIQELPPQPVLLAPATCAQDQIGPTLHGCFGVVGQEMQAQGAQMAGPPLCRYTRWGESDCDLEAGAPTDRLLQDADGVRALALGGRVATAVHVGPYERLHQSWTEGRQWLEAQGLQAVGAPWEVYLTDPGKEPDPEKWQTALFFPIR